MNEAWVINASPLILFGRIGRLDLLEQLAPRVIVPTAVFNEVRAGQEKDPSATVALDWADGRRLPDIAVPASVQHWDLGAGESQVIAHGLNGSRWVVLDDRAGRRCAAAHGLPIIGSLGVVLRAKERSRIEQARPWIAKLVAAGMFVDATVLRDALGSVGE